MMTTSAPLFVSSGDLIADRRYKWAIDHARRGDLAGAAEILAQTLELAPRFATAWFALGAIRDVLGEPAAAIAAFAAARDADPEDYHGARLHLARLGAGEVTPAMTATYVQRLFDQHAPGFDEMVQERLGYRGPQLLLDAVQAAAGSNFRFARALDLGCGTGLAGVAFRACVDHLVGVDLSAGMIALAHHKGVYDRLATLDLGEFLAEETARCSEYQLIIAADVFVYCSEFFGVAAAVAKALAPGGLFAFSVETHDGSGVLLRETLRYAHSADHVRAALDRAGLRTLSLAAASSRTEKGVPVPGLLVVAALPS